MKNKLAAAAATVAVAGTAALVASVPAATATAATPTREARPVVMRTAHVDFTGNHKKDTVQLLRTGATSYQVRVVTDKHKVSTANFTSELGTDLGISPWQGLARLDHKKGYELIVGVGDDPGIQSKVYTWRNGRVVTEKAPTQPWDSRSYWNTQSADGAQVGFHFSTLKGKRYVDAGAVVDTGEGIWKGSVVRSVWTASGWKKVSVHRLTLMGKEIQVYNFMTGAPIIDR
jgi:hypothetical protein